MHIDFPFHVDSRRRTAETTDADHVRDRIEQLIFTRPGERVNRPGFGSGLQQLVFAPNTPELAAAIQFLVQGALQQYMADVIDVGRVQVDAIDATNSARMPTQSSNASPLPMPRNVICSASQIRNTAPPTSDTVVVRRKRSPGSRTTPVTPSRARAIP